LTNLYRLDRMLDEFEVFLAWKRGQPSRNPPKNPDFLVNKDGDEDENGRKDR